MKYILFHRLAESVKDVMEHGHKPERVLENLFRKHKNMGSHDRRWVAEWMYDIVRYFRLYAYCAETEKNFWEIAGTAVFLKTGQMPDFTDLKNLKKRVLRIGKLFERAQQDSFLCASFPDVWKDLNASEKLDERVPGWMTLLNENALPIIRTNTHKVTPQDLLKLFCEKNIFPEPVPGHPGLFVMPDRRNYFQSEEFKNGLFEFQDTGSVMVGEFCGVRPGMNVVDVCAGSGGKTLYLSCQMQNRGKIIATDIHEVKLKELKKRTERAGCRNVEIFPALKNDQILHGFLNKYRNYAHVLLLDSPCTGSGVIKRNPDAKWKITREFLDRTVAEQRKILSQYAPLVAPDGFLIYATCSIFVSENEKQMEWFLNTHPNFYKTEEKFISPGTYNDGFYMCKLKKSAI